MGILSQEQVERIRKRFSRPVRKSRPVSTRDEGRNMRQSPRCQYSLCRTMYPDRPADVRKDEAYCSAGCYLRDRKRRKMPTNSLGVNQVSSSSLDADLAEAGLNQEPETADSFNRDKTGRIEIPVPFPFPPPTVATEIERELKEAGVEFEPEFDAAEVQEQLAENAARAELNKSLPLVLEIAKSSLTRDPDLREFKKQVVAAFKHLGLDTKQFFGV